MLIFETERIIVRQVGQDDLEDLYRVCGDAYLMRYVGDGNPLSVELTQKWIDVTLSNYLNKGYGMYVVVHKADKRLIGYCGLVFSKDISEDELIYALLKDYWGLGLATELARKLVDFGFGVLKLKRIFASIDPDNYASKRILSKIGFKKTFSRSDEHGLMTDYFELEPS